MDLLSLGQPTSTRGAHFAFGYQGDGDHMYMKLTDVCRFLSWKADAYTDSN